MMSSKLGHVTYVSDFSSTSISLMITKFGRLVDQHVLVSSRKGDITETRPPF